MEIGKFELIPVICSSHAIKGIRTNLENKPLEFNVFIDSQESKDQSQRQFANWGILKIAYQIDTTSNTINNNMKKLTDEHIFKEKMHIMRVKPAVQVLSKSVADFIVFLTSIGGKRFIPEFFIQYSGSPVTRLFGIP